MYGTPFNTENNGKVSSDSDESDASNNSDNTDPPSSNGEPLLAQFDDIMRISRHLIESRNEGELALLDFAQQFKFVFKDHFQALDECQRLQADLDDKVHECSDLEHKLTQARKLMDQQEQNLRMMREERDHLAKQIDQVRDLLFVDKGSKLSEEMLHKLSFLRSNSGSPAGSPGHPSGSMLSDFSYSCSEDDLDGSLMIQGGKPRKRRGPSANGVAEPAAKKRRSSGKVVGSRTTMTVSQEVMATSESILQPPEAAESNRSSTPPANLLFEKWACKSPQKAQCPFLPTIIITPATCERKRSTLPSPIKLLSPRSKRRLVLLKRKQKYFHYPED